MLHTIQNSDLTVTVSDFGAELQSILAADGTEYLWQGDAKYWTDRSPVLFPYIGRMINKSYLYGGKTYSMEIHGFASTSAFFVAEKAQDTITLSLESNESTLQQFPWVHRFFVSYKLCGSRLDITYRIENKDEKPMLFGVGGHPGFCVPLENGLQFEDYRLRFPISCAPERILFTKTCFVLPESEPMPLEQGAFIPLHHDMFDDDAIVLKNTSHRIVLESDKSKHSVTVDFPDMEYVGLWHMPHTDAPYICIEPWSSLPSASKAQTIWEEQEDLCLLESGKTYTNTWSITIQ